MRFVKKSSKTTRSNPWTRSTASSKRRLSTSSAIPRSSNPSHPSHISQSHCDMELVLHGSAPLVASEPESQRAPVAPSAPCPSSVPANVSEPSIESAPKIQNEQEILYPESQVIALRAERKRFE